MGKNKGVVHVVGTGTIGEPLIGLLCSFKDEAGFAEVTFHKRSPLPRDVPKIKALVSRGAKLVVDEDKIGDFESLGLKPVMVHDEALAKADVVVDCTPSGVGISNKQEFYEKYLPTTRGFIAQGSEFGFGKMYARGINDDALERDKDRFLQVVSCNTHNLCALINTVALMDGDDNLEEARFLCIRRANDISQVKGFVPSPDVGKHGDPVFGTHHARDAYHLFRTKGLELTLWSSALKLNTQYMHCIYFQLKLKRAVTKEEIMARFKADDRISITKKQSACEVFSFGRDHGYFGRILNQTVIVEPTIEVRKGHEVIGFCFTPQDGNSLLSSFSAAMWFLDPDTYVERAKCLKPYFFSEV
jgi:glyceraldehyde-3-phosphate dehydrogenase (NAD(P))